MKARVVITCEHGGNVVPGFIRKEAGISSEVLKTHRGYDIGALQIAKSLGNELGVRPIVNTVSRLAIDFNRSLHHPNVFSAFTKNCSQEKKDRLISLYSDYRNEVVKKCVGYTLHLSIHSFTPILNGEKRNCDFALLYDPLREREKQFAGEVKKRLNSIGIKTRLNYPYKGIADGFTTALRRQLGGKYAGLELEFNQAIVGNNRLVRKIIQVLTSTIA